jgi:hypothetical protein
MPDSSTVEEPGTQISSETPRGSRLGSDACAFRVSGSERKGTESSSPAKTGHDDLRALSESERANRYERNSYGDRLDDFRREVLAKCEDPEGIFAVALDVIVWRVRQSGINVTSPKYLETALKRFDFDGGQDREDWMASVRGRL